MNSTMRTAVASTAELGLVRARIVTALSEFGREPEHVRAVELVANELLATGLDAGAQTVELCVEPFRLLTGRPGPLRK